MRYFIEFQRDGDTYTLLTHQGNPIFARKHVAAGLGPNALVSIKGRPTPLASFAAGLAEQPVAELAALLDVRGQADLGQHLYTQLFGDVLPETMRGRAEPNVDLRIVGDDEHIPALPWPLLAHKGLFLATAGWSITLAHSAALRNVELPARPRLLIVAPQPIDMDRTRAETHLERLIYELALHAEPGAGESVRTVTTWDELRQALPAFQPHLLYFYGHGVGDRHSARLCFTAPDGRRSEIPAATLAELLAALPAPPLLAYLNCCSGEAGGFLGAGWQLGRHIPAVLANRTLVPIETAQSQANAFWQSLLTDRRPPHLAAAESAGHLASLGAVGRDARWLAPVLRCTYDQWRIPPRQPLGEPVRDPQWHLKLDRVKQHGIVYTQTRQMLLARHPRSLAYVWYGEPGQGVDKFHARLRFDLEADLPERAQLIEKRPEWPSAIDQAAPGPDFEAMLAEAFEVDRFSAIPSSIRAQTRGAQLALIYVRHRPVPPTAKTVVNPYRLATYLHWWDTVFTRLLAPGQHALLTISFEVERPDRFRELMLNASGLERMEFAGTIYTLLDEMERLALKDLSDFLQRHNIKLPPAHKERVLGEVLAATEGHYDQTVAALRRLVDRAIVRAEQGRPPASPTPEPLDY